MHNIGAIMALLKDTAIHLEFMLCMLFRCATHTQHRAHAGDRRAILARCSKISNDEKFRAQSLQQLQYRAERTVLIKKNVYLLEKNSFGITVTSTRIQSKKYPVAPHQWRNT